MKAPTAFANLVRALPFALLLGALAVAPHSGDLAGVLYGLVALALVGLSLRRITGRGTGDDNIGPSGWNRSE